MMTNQDIVLSTIYAGSVTSRIRAAQQLAEFLQAELMEPGELQDQLKVLAKTAGTVNEQMALMELGELCTKCSLQPGGGCCSLYMSGETDSIQLAVNILMGVDVQVVRQDGSECFFLGERGCIFLFKPMFCLNYLCGNIRQGCPDNQVEKLEYLMGQHLCCYYRLEQYILRRILHNSRLFI